MTNVQIEAIRRGLCETQTEFANRLGVSLATVSRWEAGQGGPTGPIAVELAKLWRLSGMWR